MSLDSDYLVVEQLQELIRGITPLEVKIFSNYLDEAGNKIIFEEDFNNKVLKYIVMVETEENKQKITEQMTLNTDSDLTFKNMTEATKNHSSLLLFIQEKLKSIGKPIEEIISILNENEGKNVSSEVLKRNLPKIGIYLTQDQQNIVFDYFLKNVDGSVPIEELKRLYFDDFHSKLHDNFDLYEIIASVHENFLKLLKKENWKLSDVFFAISSRKGYLTVDEMIIFFKLFCKSIINDKKVKMIFELIFGIKKLTSISYRMFLNLLRIFGVEVNHFDDVIC